MTVKVIPPIAEQLTGLQDRVETLRGEPGSNGELAEAQSCLEEAVQAYPGYTEAEVLLSELELRTGRQVSEAIEGRVHDESGGPVLGAMVHLIGHDPISANIQLTTTVDGTFSSMPLPPGRWEVRTRFPSGGRPAGKPSRGVPAGPEGMMVDLAAGEERFVELHP